MKTWGSIELQELLVPGQALQRWAASSSTASLVPVAKWRVWVISFLSGIGPATPGGEVGEVAGLLEPKPQARSSSASSSPSTITPRSARAPAR